MKKATYETLIIAEIGECFNGDFTIAKELMREAKKSGCDIVKFQTLDYENISLSDPEKEWFLKIALNPEKIRKLIAYARKIRIRILFSPENIKTCQWLLDAGLEDVKIASSSITDVELISFVNKNFRCVFISTGMASLKEVREIVHNLKNVYELYIMHCVSEYPTGPLLKRRGLCALAPEDVHLNMMKILMQIFPHYKIGYSDHTAGIFAPLVAVAAGAEVIEKHITLDRKVPLRNYNTGKEYLGTDHVLSLEPFELKEMVCKIREIEHMLGKWKWERSEGEKLLRGFLRKRFSGV
ncbi:MAG: N-acetylneuraminate synthase family protein [Candidatus Omnitrophica bacterium]|nr:N-acetylneuraminate synthase family protein [Candidatus Omnitrophota bacterium]